MAEQIVTRLAQPCRRLRVAPQRLGTARYRGVDAVSLEQSGDAPDTDAAAILEMCFGAEVADAVRRRQRIFAPAIAMAVALEQRVFRPFLVADHEIDCDQTSVRPDDLRRPPAVTDEIARRAMAILKLHDSTIPGGLPIRMYGSARRSGSKAGAERRARSDLPLDPGFRHNQTAANRTSVRRNLDTRIPIPHARRQFLASH